jgi:hypothetical protein
MTYPNSALSTIYTYDLGAFGKGRLSSITRNGAAFSYGYDRFGRLLQDGTLSYGYDKNGNRTSITDCFQKRCGSPLYGDGPMIVCSDIERPCGQTWPNGTITLNQGNNACPRILEAKGPTGPRDYSQTLFHEIGHTCGVGAEEPSWWQDIQRVCTGWPL